MLTGRGYKRGKYSKYAKLNPAGKPGKGGEIHYIDSRPMPMRATDGFPSSKFPCDVFLHTAGVDPDGGNNVNTWNNSAEEAFHVFGLPQNNPTTNPQPTIIPPIARGDGISNRNGTDIWIRQISLALQFALDHPTTTYGQTFSLSRSPEVKFQVWVVHDKEWKGQTTVPLVTEFFRDGYGPIEEGLAPLRELDKVQRYEILHKSTHTIQGQPVLDDSVRAYEGDSVDRQMHLKFNNYMFAKETKMVKINLKTNINIKYDRNNTDGKVAGLARSNIFMFVIAQPNRVTHMQEYSADHSLKPLNTRYIPLRIENSRVRIRYTDVPGVKIPLR